MTNPRTEVPNYPGAAKIESVIHDNGNSTNDITLFVLRIDIHSDVNITAHQCELQIADYENILERFQFGAGDAVTITIKEDGQSFERRYKVKKIADFINTENGRLYKLKLVSELEYVSFATKISRFYTGPSHEVAKSILYNFTREGEYIWENSGSDIEFIVPYWSPLQTLKWLGKKSRSLNSTSSFLFYQDSKQFWNFTSLANLRTVFSNNPITLRYYQNTLSSSNQIPNTSAIRTTIRDIKYYDAFDIKREIDVGNLKNTKYIHDLTNKTFEMKQNSYWDTFSSNALNQDRLWKQEEFGFGKIDIITLAASENERHRLRLPVDEVDEHAVYSLGQQIEITLYGNSDIDIGQIVNIEIPKPEPRRVNGDDVLDITWSGLYYVVSKHDAYDRTGHTMALRLAKDSFI